MPSPDPLPENNHSTLADELEQVVLDFEDLQAELAYDQAKGVLQSLLDRLNLTPREASSLQEEMQRLSTLLQKLDQAVIHIPQTSYASRAQCARNNLFGGLFEIPLRCELKPALYILIFAASLRVP